MRNLFGQANSHILIGNFVCLFFYEQRQFVTSRIFTGMHHNFHFRFHGYLQLFHVAVTKPLRYGEGLADEISLLSTTRIGFRKGWVCFLINARSIVFYASVYRSMGIGQLEHISYVYCTTYVQMLLAFDLKYA